MKHSDLIKELGGGTELARLLNEALGSDEIDREAVYKWAKLDRIPWRWRPVVVAVARAQGKPIPEDFAETVQ
jgi:hypothetical protein